MHLLQAGLVLQVEATLDELQASFKTSVPDPLTHLAEVAERGTVRERPADYVHGSVPDELCHDEAQTKAELLWYVPLEKYVAVAVGPPGLLQGLTLETASLKQVRVAIALKAPDPPRAALITPRKLSGKLQESCSSQGFHLTTERMTCAWGWWRSWQVTGQWKKNRRSLWRRSRTNWCLGTRRHQVPWIC